MEAMSEAALLEALREALTSQEDGEGGMTAPELAGLLGVNKETVRVKLRRLIEGGKARPVKVKRTRLDGIVHTVSGYRIVA